MLKATPIAAIVNVLVSWFGGDNPAPAPAYPLVTAPVVAPSHAIEIPDAAVDAPLIPVGPMFDMVNLSYTDREDFFVVTTRDFARITLPDENLVVVQATRHMLLVSFSGTQKFSQWRTNLNCKINGCKTNPRALQAALEAVYWILIWVRNHPWHAGKPMLLCGHSLGGALARISAVIFQALKGNPQSPKIDELYSVVNAEYDLPLKRYTAEYPAWVIAFTVSAPLFVNGDWPTGPITEISLTGDLVGRVETGNWMNWMNWVKSSCPARQSMVLIPSELPLLGAHRLEAVRIEASEYFGPNMPAPNGTTVHQAKKLALALKEPKS